MTTPALRLTRGDDLDGLLDEIAEQHAGRAGLDAVLADLDRDAVRQVVPARAAEYGFAWDRHDVEDDEWWPQGITTTADAANTDDLAGRRVVVVGWYAKKLEGRPSRGTRVTFVDVTDPDTPRYRHVLLTQPVRDDAGTARLTPVRVHAGGIIWYGRSLLVADTHGGVRTFGLDDVLRVEADGDRHEYVLPQRTSYRSVPGDGVAPFRFSFVSLDRSGDEHQLIAGEYGVGEQTTRLVRFGFDAAAEALALVDGEAHPLEFVTDGLQHMQGATVVGGTFYISTSRGRFRRGALWTRRPGEPPREHPATLAIGPEDLTYWPQRDQLWSCSEYPGKRYVYAMPRSAFPLT